MKIKTQKKPRYQNKIHRNLKKPKKNLNIVNIIYIYNKILNFNIYTQRHTTSRKHPKIKYIQKNIILKQNK